LVAAPSTLGTLKNPMVDSTEERTRSHAWSTPQSERLRVMVFWDGGTCARGLAPGESLIVGRAEGSDLHVLHPSVSRRHAKVHGGPPTEVEDLGSANGIRVGGVLVARRRIALWPGQIVEVGGAVLVLQAADSGPTLLDTNDAPGAAMARINKLVSLVARSHLSVLVFGETGVGKELTAEALHAQSSRAKGAFLRINCAASTESLLESELFGFEKGAFTGARHTKIGLIEAANGGTLFLDEVGEMPPATQAMLLRVLENHELRRIGAVRPTPVDVRIVAATHRNLRALIDQGSFREDLFFRLNGVSITVPPLRERRGEVAALARTFADNAAVVGDARPTFAPGVFAALEAHDWPGNVRELRNAVERAVVLAHGAPIELGHLQLDDHATSPPAAALTTELQSLERSRIVDALERARGNQTLAAEMLGVSRRTLINRIVQYNLPRPRKPR
jgi:two-component system response regulator AtoC